MRKVCVNRALFAKSMQTVPLIDFLRSRAQVFKCYAMWTVGGNGLDLVFSNITVFICILKSMTEICTGKTPYDTCVVFHYLDKLHNVSSFSSRRMLK